MKCQYTGCHDDTCSKGPCKANLCRKHAQKFCSMNSYRRKHRDQEISLTQFIDRATETGNNGISQETASTDKAIAAKNKNPFEEKLINRVLVATNWENIALLVKRQVVELILNL